ncbi:MAG: type II toxin-antitoxin system death-on-curing family toxin [Burkholderiaceae bacterium]
MAWRWIPKQALLRLHEISLAQFGGAPGLRDIGLLESALARPENPAAYDQPDFVQLAASLGVGLAKNHPFVDGNKRAAFLAVGVFLRLNGYQLTASQPDATITMFAVAAGELNEADFADWIRRNAQPFYPSQAT